MDKKDNKDFGLEKKSIPKELDGVFSAQFERVNGFFPSLKQSTQTLDLILEEEKRQTHLLEQLLVYQIKIYVEHKKSKKKIEADSEEILSLVKKRPVYVSYLQSLFQSTRSATLNWMKEFAENFKQEGIVFVLGDKQHHRPSMLTLKDRLKNMRQESLPL